MYWFPSSLALSCNPVGGGRLFSTTLKGDGLVHGASELRALPFCPRESSRATSGKSPKLMGLFFLAPRYCSKPTSLPQTLPSPGQR